MKIKVFRTLEPCDIDNYMEFDEWEDFIIDGNNDYKSYHSDYNLYKNLFAYCIESDALSDYITDAEDHAEYRDYDTATAAIKDLLEFTPSTKQVHDIKVVLESGMDEDEKMAELLTICEKRQWVTRQITGCCQGDWNCIFYPVDSYNDEFIDYIESVYFNTRDEYAYDLVTDDDLSGSPKELPDACYDYLPSSINYDTDKVKAHFAEFYGMNPDDVILYEPHETTTTTWSFV